MYRSSSSSSSQSTRVGDSKVPMPSVIVVKTDLCTRSQLLRSTFVLLHIQPQPLMLLGLCKIANMAYYKGYGEWEMVGVSCRGVLEGWGEL
ncbi:hypothetical protein Tco_1201194 [Tanacetum coccineum]